MFRVAFIRILASGKFTFENLVCFHRSDLVTARNATLVAPSGWGGFRLLPFFIRKTSFTPIKNGTVSEKYASDKKFNHPEMNVK